jgi:hypothetical protein
VISKSEDASLGKFLRVTGGYLNKGSIGVPLGEDENSWLVSGDKLDGDSQGQMSKEVLSSYVTHGEEGPVAEFNSSKSCGEKPAELQVFVYKFNKADKTYSQHKVENPEDYVIREESSLGPPSDCVIFEFDSLKDRTDKLCEQYGVRDITRCEKFGVKADHKTVCDIHEVSEEV